MANAPEPSAGSQTVSSRISAALVVVPSWSSSSSSACPTVNRVSTSGV